MTGARILFLSFLMILGFELSAQAAIFGLDTRRAILPGAASNSIAKATAIAILSSNTTANNDGTFKLDTGSAMNLCPNEKFATDRDLQYSCTGFLIAPDLLVTAGHCVYAVNTPNKELKNETGLACKAFSWLFDYQDTEKGKVDSEHVATSRLYGCKQIIYAKQTERAPFVDYALIQLDRPVLGRTPLTIADYKPRVGAMISMVGYPFGTPVKISDQARITLDDPKRDSFLTTLDAFSGNSGSPVMDGSGRVLGILIGGTPSNDLVDDVANKCQRLNKCTESGTKCLLPDTNPADLPGYQGVGSEAQRIAPIAELLKQLKLARSSPSL